jgi:hypothetical protein
MSRRSVFDFLLDDREEDEWQRLVTSAADDARRATQERLLAADDGAVVRVRATLHLLGGVIENEIRVALAALDDQLMVLRHCPTATGDLAERTARRDQLATVLADSVRPVDVAIGRLARLTTDDGVRRQVMRRADQTLATLRHHTLTVVRHLVDSGAAHISAAPAPDAPCAVRVADDSADSRRRCEAFADELARLASLQQQVGQRLQYEIARGDARAALALNYVALRRHQAQASIDAMRCRQEARVEVNSISDAELAS